MSFRITFEGVGIVDTVNIRWQTVQCNTEQQITKSRPRFGFHCKLSVDLRPRRDWVSEMWYCFM